MARTKPNPAYVVADLDAADKALSRLAEIKRDFDTEMGKLNAAVDRMKALSKERLAAKLAEGAAIEAALATFAETKKDELFGKARSKALTFGVFGFRRSSEVKPVAKPRTTWAAILEKIKSLATKEDGDPFQAAIRVKEEVDRDVLKTWPEERLAEVGARIVGKDTFYYELDAQEIKGEAA
ncbi:host-nuclease inhibitor Gam family protein [Solidesulfovibrio sp.]|uniref:host-nuclease inhibitor Gam family protein n=1 Tax=Solidesulfovibrio sp. TaxID=2910990 RepID=UPI002B203F2B|nr:host-nuclease inhibitor Gam family protein [Solidesulfovibrio sp.]MEA5087278.1 host-nuclease inhibitor Gam family protein [Solidesulfovibrio sp.]